MRTVLVSTYDLGHQPQLGAELAAICDDLEVVDLTRSPGAIDLAGAGRVIVTAPMFTGSVAAKEYIEDHQDDLAGKPVVLAGLYASVLESALDPAVRERLSLRSFDRFQLQDLLKPAKGGDPSRPTAKRAYRAERRGLLPLAQYRKVLAKGASIANGYVEASIGCRHRCLHCPVAAVWDGRIAVNDANGVLADIEEQHRLGARHFSFGDPDFFNAPQHTIPILQEAHRRLGEVTFDITVKVSELVKHEEWLDGLAENGLAFVISAVESLSPEVLAKLGKGHTPEEVFKARDLLFERGVGLHPTFVPFTPWTTRDDILDILDFVWNSHLEDVVEPVQYSIELLTPQNSLIDRAQGGFLSYDPDVMGYPFEYRDSALSALQRKIALLASACGDGGYAGTFEAIYSLVETDLGRSERAARPARRAPEPVVVTEPWFCCAAPIR